MTKEQLDAIRARVEAATPGPWLTDSCLDVYTEQVREIDPDIGIELYKTVYSHHTAGPEGTQPWHDTHFMAHAREDVPALLAEVERLNARIVTVAAVITDNGCMCDCGCDVGYGHFKDSDCNPCLVCRVSDALLEEK